MVGSIGADGKNVHIRRYRAGPGVLDGQLNGICLVKRGSWGRKQHFQIVIIAHCRRTLVLYAYIGKSAGHDWTKVPGNGPRRIADSAAGRRHHLRRNRARVREQPNQDCGRKQTGKSSHLPHWLALPCVKLSHFSLLAEIYKMRFLRCIFLEFSRSTTRLLAK
jgi:hypothetical protein